jgi:hypothetical protein
MMMGLGQTSTTAVTPPTFTQGLTMWTAPTAVASDGGNALFETIGSLVSNPTTAFSSALLPFTAGVLLPPVALVFVLMGMKKGKH